MTSRCPASWVRLLAEESDTVLVLPNYYQVLPGNIVMYTFLHLAEPDSSNI